jgi:hypothetical protein
MSFRGIKLTSRQNAVEKIDHDTDHNDDASSLSHAVLEQVESVEANVGFLLLGKTSTASRGRDDQGKHTDAESEEVVGQEDANISDATDSDHELARHGSGLRVGCADNLWR